MESVEEIIKKSYFYKMGVITEDDEKTILSSVLMTTFDHPLNQLFDFPATYMHYILRTTTSDIYEKLIKTCKYVYSNYRILVINSVEMLRDDLTTYHKAFSSTFLPLSRFHKIWPTKKMSASSSSELLQKVCKKIYKCTVAVLCIYDQKITEKEFNLLIAPDFLLSITVMRTSITKINGDNFYCEDIMENIPKAIEVDFHDVLITPDTFSKISQMSRINKLKTFKLNIYFANQYLTFDSKQFKDFVKKCAAPNAYFNLLFYYSKYYENATRLERDRDELKQFLKTWIPVNEKPTLFLL